MLSEIQKLRPNERVSRFLRNLPPESTYISVLSFGELRKGIALLTSKDVSGATKLTRWVDHLEIEFADRVLDVTQPIARIWGELAADRTRPFVDTLLAATALHHGLVLVTRNVRDMDDTPVQLHNPWS